MTLVSGTPIDSSIDRSKRSIAKDVTENSKIWEETLSHQKTQAIMTQMIEHVLGNQAASLPVMLHNKMIQTYVLWATGKTGDLYMSNLAPEERLQHSYNCIQTMVHKEQLNAQIKKAPILLSKNNIPVADPTSKSDKFLDVIKLNSHVQHQFLGKNMSSFQYCDFGGGDGRMAKTIAQALDLQKAPINIDPANYDNPQCQQIKPTPDNTIPVNKDTFDLVTMNMVLHHFVDTDTTLSELHRVMKEGATLVMRETDTELDDGVESFQHVMDKLWYAANPHSKTCSNVPHGKMHFRDRNEIQRFFEKHGFKLVATEVHDKDQDSAFNAKFFIFRCEKGS